MQGQTLKKHEYDMMQEHEKVLKQLNEQKGIEERSYQDYIKTQYVKKIEESEIKKKFDRGVEIGEEKVRQEWAKKDILIEKNR